jgi:hypothetical protein
LDIIEVSSSMTITIRSCMLKEIQPQVMPHTPKQEGEAEEAEEGPENVFVGLSFTC